ncbi:MAG: acyl--CoA ligase, partial [Rhodospirillaceae bacterium]|nr:acyl--CoA ligase [Rhodospirillaceae bacterium]
MECLNDMLVRNARNIGDKTYIITDEESVTYAQFDARSSRLAHVLSQRGVKKGDRVGLYLPSKLIMVYGFWACQKLGAIAVPMSAMYRETEISNILKSTGMVAIITDDETYPLLAKVRPNFPTLKTVLTDGTSQAGETPLAELMAKAPEQVPHVPCMLSDIACMFFTSGTTGIPKGTMQTHKAICSSHRDMMAFHRTQFGQEIYYCAAPLFNNLGMNVTVNFTMYTGGTVVVHDRWNTRRVLDSIKKHKITFLPGTPTMFVYMLNEYDPKTDDLTS